MSIEPLTQPESSARAALQPERGHDQLLADSTARLERCEALLRATSFAASQLSIGSWQEALPAVLRALGEAADGSRIGVSKGNATPQAGAQWSAIGGEDTKNLAWDEALWRDLSAPGEMIQLQSGDSPGAARFLQLRGAQAIASAPIRVENQVWGTLFIEECRAPRVFESAELESLALVAALIGAAIVRETFGRALQVSETELRALFAAMHDAIFVLDRDGRYLKVVANDEPLLYRPASELLGKTIGEIFEASLSREFLGLIRDVLDSQSPRDLEYPMEIGEETRWFSASVTPLSNHTVLWVAHDVTPAHRAALSLRESESLFRLLAENSTDKIARISLEGEFLYVSPSVLPLLGFSPAELVGTSAWELIHPDDHGLVAKSLSRLQAAPALPDLVSYRMRQKSGAYIYFETTSRLVFDENGANAEVHAVSRDISERRAGEEALREAEAKYRSIFENAVEGIFQSTPDGHYLDANPSLARIYGYQTPKELLSQLVDISKQLYIDPRRRLDFVAEMEENGAVSGFEAQIQRKDGQIIWISENARCVRDARGALLYYEGTVEDITARKNAEGQLLHDALHDKLTGLSNRALFMDRLGQAFSRLKRHPNAPFAALFLDFDRFKTVNDSLGHMAGDQLLIAVSRRIAECLRPGDTVSRFGGDEFAILLDDIADIGGAIIVAERIQESLTAPFRIAGQEVFTSASIGIALGTVDYQHPEELLRDADMAMYRAKALGKARHHVFDAGMHTRAVALLQLETDLRHAIERDEFRVHYQPIIGLQSGRITGFEALVRWQHPTRGLVSPLEFIPIAEETGWIVPLGRHVLEVACAQIAQWHRATGDESLSMSVNLSSKQFAQPDLLLEIQAVLRRYDLPAASLKLEITESALMERAQEITDRLVELQTLGVKLGLDDFGTGYSSLSYLHRFPLDTLKIDRSFIARMSQNGSENHRDGDENREIVRTIVSLGKNLGMNVVAEGVETANQLADLRELGCNSGQGYFFARPLVAEEALRLLQSAPVW